MAATASTARPELRSVSLSEAAAGLATAGSAESGGRLIARVVIEFVDGGSFRWSAPMRAEDEPARPSREISTLARKMLDVLSRYKQGEWVKGATIAIEIDDDLDHKSGTFRRGIAEISNWAIEAGPNGYRLLDTS